MRIRKEFTLIEMLIVIVMVSAILALIVVPRLLEAITKNAANTQPAAAEKAERDPTEQWVVYDPREENPRFHYINREIGNAHDGALVTSCGEELWLPFGAKMVPLAEAERLKMVPCGHCSEALQRFVNSVSARPHEYRPTVEDIPDQD